MIREMFQGVPRPTYEDGRPHVHPLGKRIVRTLRALRLPQTLGAKLLDDFSKLRVAFLEAGSEWTVRRVSHHAVSRFQDEGFVGR